MLPSPGIGALLVALHGLCSIAAASPLQGPAAQLPFASVQDAGRTRVPSLASLASELDPEHFRQLVQHVESLPERRLVRWAEDGTEQWVSEGEKALLVYVERGRRFVDVTDAPQLDLSPDAAARSAIPTELRYRNKTLEPVFAKTSIDRLEKRLRKFTSFRTRYYRSSTGRESQKWLLNLVESLAEDHPESNVSVREFPHSWGQNTVIARFEPVRPGDDDTVIIGAHQDSTNLLPFLPAPGADDDGSGTVTLLEALTSLLEVGWRPARGAVEFQWYSAEEGGMLGSGDVARSYKASGASVRAMLQFDMTAWVKRGTRERVGIVNDFVSPELSAFLRLLIDEYLAIPWVDTKCGYACSDHSSWTSIGVPSAFGIEATFEDSNTGNIHSTRDTIDTSSEFRFSHINQFVRLSLAYLVEMAGGVDK